MQFGRLSTGDLRLLLSFLPMLEGEAVEAMSLVKEKSEHVFSGPASKVYWCNFYEMPFIEHLAKFIVAFGLTDMVKDIAAAPNQMEAIAASVECMDAEIASNIDSASKEELEQVRTSLPIVLALATSVNNSFRSLLAFGCYLNDLIAQARAGDDRALFNAIRIDPTVVGCPTAIARISRAVLVDDKRFMAKWKAALNGKLQKREQANFQKMRAVLQVLSESGVTQLTDLQLHELFVKQLRLYSTDSKAGDVTKNLRKFANQYKKVGTTT